MTPYFEGDGVTLYHGDCRDVLRTMTDNTIDAIVTDPPYGLEFMGREWDTFKPGGKRPKVGDADGTPFRRTTGTPSWSASNNPVCRNCGGTKYDRTRPNGCTCEQPSFPNEAAAHMRAFQEWSQEWAVECLRVLKPGGHMLAFGGTRTWHRLACAIEDAGFEVRNTVADLIGRDAPGLIWAYGSGFPKSLDVSKAINKAALGDFAGVGPLTATEDAKRWEGWGTALKPAWEPIIVARKPLAGTVAANVLAYGTGALHIDACRAGDPAPSVPQGRIKPGPSNNRQMIGRNGEMFEGHPAGRWPTNLVFTHSATCVEDGPCAAGCPVAELDRQSGVSVSRVGKPRAAAAPGDGWGMTKTGIEYADAGGASRFFPVFRYEPKAPASERPKVNGVAHETVKPLALMRWLIRLVTPPGGTVLDPFLGSGTTAEACLIEGFNCIGIERDERYLPLAVARLSKPLQPVLFGEAS